METKTHHRFVGLIMALFIPGSAHVMSGRWKTGIIWLFSLVAFTCLDFFVSSIPVSLSFSAFIAIQMLIVSLYVIYYVSLLVSSYRLFTPRLGYCGWFLFLLATLTFYTIANDLLSVLVRTHICRHDRVRRWAMYPTLQPETSGTSHWGDKTMLSTLAYRFNGPHRGDIVGCKIVEQPWWQQPEHINRRVVGLPGETVDICPPYVLINGEKLLDPPIFAKISSREDGYSGYDNTEGMEPEGLALPITLGPDEYFLLGDNPLQSLDSRHFGPVSRKAIIGKEMRIVFPPWRIREL
jgi:signal peptidase I